MKIIKAVITAAGPNQNELPLQMLVDSDGRQKSALRILLDEAAAAGIERVCIVIRPGDSAGYRRAAGDSPVELSFMEQPEPRGYGHALFCAREFTGADSFLHMVGDHLFVSSGPSRCAQELVGLAAAAHCAVSAVQPTREGLLTLFGAVGGRGVPNQPRVHEIERVLEKPTPTLAEQQLIVPGMRAGYYLCFFGMHVLTPGIMAILGETLEGAGGGAKASLSPALQELARRERYLAAELAGRRYNLGEKFGLLNAQLALALAGRDREEVLAQLVELLASRNPTPTPCPGS